MQKFKSPSFNYTQGGKKLVFFRTQVAQVQIVTLQYSLNYFELSTEELDLFAIEIQFKIKLNSQLSTKILKVLTV